MYISSSSESEVPITENELVEKTASSRLGPTNLLVSVSKESKHPPNVKKMLFQALKELQIIQSCSSFSNSSSNGSENESVNLEESKVKL